MPVAAASLEHEDKEPPSSILLPTNVNAVENAHENDPSPLNAMLPLIRCQRHSPRNTIAFENAFNAYFLLHIMLPMIRSINSIAQEHPTICKGNKGKQFLMPTLSTKPKYSAEQQLRVASRESMLYEREIE